MAFTVDREDIITLVLNRSYAASGRSTTFNPSGPRSATPDAAEQIGTEMYDLFLDIVALTEVPANG